MNRTHFAGHACAFAVTLMTGAAFGKTYQVGPTRTTKTLNAITGALLPGDIVEVDGNATYAGGIVLDSPGAAGNPITISGIAVSGKLPVLSGGTNSIEVRADHYVLEGFEVTGGTSRCVYHHADDVVMRSLVVHGCPAQGLLGADQDSGSLTLEYSEFYGSGSGTFDHQIYMATDEVAHPGSVFRMQHCYVHDGAGGNNVKSRAERNEIYYNWIESASVQELELIGPDPNGAQPTWTEALKREDSDVVGNVLWQKNAYSVARFGGDGTGQSNGRYRFVNNTVLTQAGGGAVFRLFDGIESVEMDNNVFTVAGGTGLNLLREVEALWVAGRQVAGKNNWVQTGASNTPPEWTGTVVGADPSFVALATNQLRPKLGSGLIDAGASSLAGPAGYAFPSPLAVPAFEPPMHEFDAPPAAARVISGPIDIGAYEYTPPSTGTGGTGGTGGTTSSSGGATSSSGGATSSSGGATSSSGGATSSSGGATSSSGGATSSSGGATSSSGGAGPSVGGATETGGTADGGIAPASSSDKGGCGCRITTSAGERRSPWPTTTLGLGFIVVARRKRRASLRARS